MQMFASSCNALRMITHFYNDKVLHIIFNISQCDIVFYTDLSHPDRSWHFWRCKFHIVERFGNPLFCTLWNILCLILWTLSRELVILIPKDAHLHIAVQFLSTHQFCLKCVKYTRLRIIFVYCEWNSLCWLGIDYTYLQILK